MTKTIAFYITGVFIVGFLFFIKGLIFLDPDFGWHLGMGRYILEHGIPKTDPFSYTMPSYPFVDHEWLTNIGIAWLYPKVSMWGLSIISSILILAAFLIPLPKGINKWSVIPLILSLAALIPFIGVRPQVETWFLLAVLIKTCFEEKLWHKFKFFLPLLFIIWVNLHGGFASGIIALFIILALKFLEGKKIIIHDLLVVILSILATFLNPYGTRIWWEVWMQISDSGLRWSISEWTPILFRIDPAFILYLAFSSILVWQYRKKLGWPKVGLFFGLALAGISSQRHIPLWLVASLPAVSLAFQYLYEQIKKEPISLKRFNLIYKILLAVAVIIFMTWSTLTLQSASHWNEARMYPQKATPKLSANTKEGHIFAPYFWGGYLIWKLPEEKIFIDGRMPSWRWTSPAQNESDWAFQDYNKVISDEKSTLEIFKKFNITTVIWQAPPKEGKPNIFEDWQNKLGERLFGKKTSKPFLNVLKEAGWKEIYRDDIAIIYQEP